MMERRRLIQRRGLPIHLPPGVKLRFIRKLNDQYLTLNTGNTLQSISIDTSPFPCWILRGLLGPDRCGAIPGKQISTTSKSPAFVSIPSAPMIIPVTSRVDFSLSPTNLTRPDSSSSIVSSSSEKYFCRGGGAGIECYNCESAGCSCYEDSKLTSRAMSSRTLGLSGMSMYTVPMT